MSRRAASAKDDVIIIDDDLSSPEDEVPPARDSGSGDNKQTSLEPDAKKPKLEESPEDVAAIALPAMPAPTVDDAMLKSIPMPSQLSPLPVVAAEVQCSPVMADEKVSVSVSPMPAVFQEQHSTPADEQKTLPASIGQNVTSSDASYAFKRLTELPMPPAETDDECDSPSESNR